MDSSAPYRYRGLAHSGGTHFPRQPDFEARIDLKRVFLQIGNKGFFRDLEPTLTIKAFREPLGLITREHLFSDHTVLPLLKAGKSLLSQARTLIDAVRIEQASKPFGISLSDSETLTDLFESEVAPACPFCPARSNFAYFLQRLEGLLLPKPRTRPRSN